MLSASQTVGALGQKISQLEKSKAKVDRFGSLKKEIQETERRFFEAQNESKALAAQLAATAKPTKKLQSQFDAANRKAKKLKTSLGEQRTSLSELRREMASTGIKTGQLVMHNQKLAQSIDLARRKQDKLQKTMMKQKALQDKRAGMQGKLFDAAAIGTAVAFPTMISARFEQSMAEVKALTGATGKDFEALTASARKLGSTTSFSASEAAQGMKYLGMAGFSTNQIVSAMPGVLNMAKAGAVELGMASDIASDIMSGFGLEATDMGRVSNVLTRTFTSSNTSLEMLGETMKYVAPIASKAGMSLEETSAMAGLLGNVGIKASMAGTTLKGMVLGIAAPTAEASEALGKLGISTADAQGNIRPMTGILGDLAKATKDMGNAEKLDVVKTIFGKVSAAGITELLSKAGEDGIEAYVKKVREGKETAESIAKVMDDTTVGALKGLGSAAEGLAIVFGNTLTPMITATAHGLAFVTRGLTAAAEKFPNLTKVVGILTGGTIALATAAVAGGYAWTFVSSGLLQAKKMFQLVNLCMSASTIKTVALSAAQKAAAIGTYAMTAAQWALNVALNANPIGIIVGGVAALVGLGAVLYKKFEPFQKLVDSIWGKIKKFMKIGGRFFGFGSDEETETAEKAAKVGNVAGNIPTPPDNVVPFPERQSQGVTPVKFPEVSPAAMNSSSTAIEYKPQINITATGSNVAEFKAAADQSMMESEERVRKVMTDIHHDDRRRAFA
ncbi:phage tail tape measure protein [Desulfoluna butyratoxydans]|nr:phage tail tape measure protein [Desulfoluna butyratoxydans]